MILSGTQMIPVQLPAIDGSTFDSKELAGKPLMLSFFRFASCPFCNMRIHQLVNRFQELESNFNIIAIFDSPIEHLIKTTSKHQAPFLILADEKNTFYQKYQIQHSIAGIIKGMFLRMPTLITGMLKGYLPLKIKGSLTTMPADFLIDPDGIIQTAYYGKDEGDHLPFDQILHFSKQYNSQ